jgi:N-formylglutamate amidohydrolase
MSADLSWWPAGTAFDAAKDVYWQGKWAGRSLNEALRAATLLLLGPHAGAALPEELRPFVAPDLTRRQQLDYSDISTSALARAWCDVDPALVYIENPVSRLVLDPNRPAPADIEPGLREAFARIAATAPGALPKLAGVDAVRPITFAGQPVLRSPLDEAQWRHLIGVLNACALRGPRAYSAHADHLLDECLALREGRGDAPLHVVSLHDTMNTTCGADGAIVVARAESDRLPALANLGNRGDATGAVTGDAPLTIAAGRLRSVAAALRRAFEAPAAAVTLNAPYKGAEETRRFGRRLQAFGAGPVGAWQFELLREAILGERACAALRRPGSDWPAADVAHVQSLAERLHRAHQCWSAA